MEHYKLDFSNYADDTSLYKYRSTFLETLSDLEITLDNLLNYFCHNNFKANALKCYLSLSPFNAKSINIKSSVIEGSSSEKFLGITIDSNFNFEKYINELCNKGNLKLHAPTRCAKFMSTEKRRLIFKTFIMSQFNYFPLVWMFHTKQLNNRINSLHDKALRVTYQDRNSSLNFIVNRRNIRTSKFGFETVSKIGAILWNDLPAELKTAESLKIFKQKIKLWVPNGCPCKICRKFIKNLRYTLHQKPKKKKKKKMKLLRKKSAVSLAKFIMYKIV